MHILFLTSNNLATNPRLYKELKLAIQEGHQTSLIQYKLGNWSDEKSDEMMNCLTDYSSNSNTDLQLLDSSITMLYLIKTIL